MANGSSAPSAAHTEPPTSGTTTSLTCYCGRPGCLTPDECRRIERGAEIDWWQKSRQPVRWNIGKAAA